MKTVETGGVFGEYGLISKVPRQASVVVKEKAKILSLARCEGWQVHWNQPVMYATMLSGLMR